MRLLLALTDPALTQLLLPVLDRWGYAPAVRGSVASAVDELTTPGGARLGLVGLEAEREPGLEVCRQVRRAEGADRPYLIALALSPSGPSAAEALAAGADDHVTSSAGMWELAARLEAGQRILAWQAMMVRLWRNPELADLLEWPMVTVCAACKKMRTPAGAWVPFSGLLPGLGEPCSHGYCPGCHEELLRRAECEAQAWKALCSGSLSPSGWN